METLVGLQCLRDASSLGVDFYTNSCRRCSPCDGQTDGHGHCSLISHNVITLRLDGVRCCFVTQCFSSQLVVSGRGANIVMSMSVFVCLFVRLSVCLSARISPKPRSRSSPFCACCLWLWLGPPLTALRCVVYFRFGG